MVVPVAMMLYGDSSKLDGNLMQVPSPKNTPSPGRSSWSGALPVWLLPTFAPYPTLPFPAGHMAAIRSAWWWKPTNGPIKLADTSPSATPELGPIIEHKTLPCFSAWLCSHMTDPSTMASWSTCAPHCNSESRTTDPPPMQVRSSAADSTVTR